MSKKMYFQYTPPPKTAWDDLPMSEKADIMKSCVRNGIISPQDIRTAYNNRNILEGIPDYQANAIEFGNFLAGGGIKYGKPYYSYDDEGRKVEGVINYNTTLPETVIIPDSRKSPAQRNEDERFRQRFNRNYAEQQARDYTTRQSIAAQREWENSFQKKALDLGITAVQGIGMASDVVSPFFGGIPVYGGLKGAQALDRAISTNELADYADAALWLSPMLTVAGKKVYDAAKPAIQNIFQKGTPAAEWSSSINSIIENGANREEMFKGGLFEYLEQLNRQDTKAFAELGRKDLLDEMGTTAYREKWKKTFPKLSNEMVDAIVQRQQKIVKDMPFDYSLSSEELSTHSGFDTWGSTEPKPGIEHALPDGRQYHNMNTGADVYIANNRGKAAQGTGYHEGQHYMTGMAKGTNWFAQRGHGHPEVTGIFDPITFEDKTDVFIPRGELWQHAILDQNDRLLPQADRLYSLAVNRPTQLKNELIGIGKTPKQAEKIVKDWAEEAQDMMDIQEQRAHLKTFFKDKVKPLLKNPEDATEIESVLYQHPELIEDTPKVKLLMETLRPGSIKDYAKYFAESLSVLPLINKIDNGR